MPISARVAARYAKEFSSPEALDEYLHEHPKADPHNHTVKKSEPKSEPENEPAPKKTLEGLAGKFKDAPEAAQKFISDADHRKEIVNKASKSILASPRKYLKSLIATAKHEVHEFKAAGKAIAALMRGKKPSKAEKKAIRTVATHMAITAAAAALTSATPALAGLAIGKAIAKHIALKAVTDTLGRLHMFEELGHIGHGLAEIMKLSSEEEGKKLTSEEVLAAVISKRVAEELKSFSEDDLVRALGGSDKTAFNVALRYMPGSQGGSRVS